MRLADFMELLLLFSITTPWYNQTKNLVELIPIFANLIENRRTIKSQINSYPSKIYLFKFKNRNNRKRYKICPKLTIKTRQWFRYGVFIDDLEHILHLFSVFFFFFLALNRWMLDWHIRKTYNQQIKLYSKGSRNISWFWKKTAWIKVTNVSIWFPQTIFFSVKLI